MNICLFVFYALLYRSSDCDKTLPIACTYAKVYRYSKKVVVKRGFFLNFKLTISDMRNPNKK